MQEKIGFNMNMYSAFTLDMCNSALTLMIQTHNHREREIEIDREIWGE